MVGQVVQYLDQQAGVAWHVRLAEVSGLGVLQPQHRCVDRSILLLSQGIGV